MAACLVLFHNLSDQNSNYLWMELRWDYFAKSVDSFFLPIVIEGP